MLEAACDILILRIFLAANEHWPITEKRILKTVFVRLSNLVSDFKEAIEKLIFV
jgi:hypothetical protein